jgi:hypothetical protein
VRVTVAGPSILGAAIHSTSHTGQVDWRSDCNSLRYTETAVPDAIRNSINRYLRRFNILVWGVRFQRGPTGPLVVLPIASAIADLLIGDTEAYAKRSLKKWSARTAVNAVA